MSQGKKVMKSGELEITVGKDKFRDFRVIPSNVLFIDHLGERHGPGVVEFRVLDRFERRRAHAYGLLKAQQFRLER